MENINATELIQAIVSLLVALVSIFIIPLIKKKVGNENMTEFLKWVDIAVAAAEQLYASTQGELKKKYVLSYLKEKGFTVAEEDLNLAVEAAVNRLHNELYGKSTTINGQTVNIAGGGPDA